MRKKLSGVIGLFCTVYLIIVGEGCGKEYSYEGGLPQGSPIWPDSLNVPAVIPSIGMLFPYCDSCSNTDPSAGLTWSFKTDTAVVCGNVTRGVKSPDGGGMTFFGPSSCSLDSGLIITAFFTSGALNENQSNLIATNVILQYYDNAGTADLLQSKRPYTFALTILSYSILTKIARGTFEGSVVDKNGNVVIVEAGRFNIIL